MPTLLFLVVNVCAPLVRIQCVVPATVVGTSEIARLGLTPPVVRASKLISLMLVLERQQLYITNRCMNALPAATVWLLRLTQNGLILDVHVHLDSDSAGDCRGCRDKWSHIFN